MNSGPNRLATTGPRLTIAKRAVLALLAQYFCLTTNDLAAILHGRIPTEPDRRGTRRSLSTLLSNGLVRRMPYFGEGHFHGGTTFAYGLTDRGARFMRESDGLFPYAKSLDEHSLRTLDHELEISRFHMALKWFCARHCLRLAWRQSALKHTVHPDALFSITNPGEPPERQTAYYFLEIERSKLGHYRNGEPQILTKLDAYFHYFDSDACAEEWGEAFRQFRVVIVQRSEERRANLLSVLATRYRHRMFWLTTEELYRQDIGGAIFQTPRDFDARGYGFLDK